MGSMKTAGGKGMAERIKFIGPNGETKKTKERTLGDITNRLEARPVNLKPGWVGIRQEKEKLFKKVAAELKVGRIGPEEEIVGQFSFSFPPKSNSSSLTVERVGAHGLRPLDPPALVPNTAPDPCPNRVSPKLSAAGKPRGADKGSQVQGAGEDEQMQEEAWSDCQSDEAMEATPSLD